MFLDFFYLLRAKGLKVSINEWMVLMEALDKGLAHSSLLSFYNLCRSILVNTEADFDKFDTCFAEYFKDVQSLDDMDLPEEFWEWLDSSDLVKDYTKEEMEAILKREFEEILRMFEERKEEQKEKHDGGKYWIGTGGRSTMGRGGYNPAGVRTGGVSRHKSAVRIAGEHNFKDFRDDNVLDIRQFQVAFRKLRQYSSRMELQETEFDIDKTIKETADNAGVLSIEYSKPRRNAVKVLLLMDSAGTMIKYSELCNRLFQALKKANNFKDLQVYYFHNCIYENIYTDPTCKSGKWIQTDWLFRNLDRDYKVIIVGDGTMAPPELFEVHGNALVGGNDLPGLVWLRKFEQRYKKAIWLNPIPKNQWETIFGRDTIAEIAKVFPMFELTMSGLDQGIKRLLVR